MMFLIRRYENYVNLGFPTLNTALEIYKQLINDGVLCEDLIDEDKTMDMFLVDLKYEFADEFTLELLANELSMIATLDYLVGLRATVMEQRG